MTEELTRNLWFSFKRRMQAKFPGEEWIRPMYLLKAMRVNAKQVHLLATLPPNGRMISGACDRLPLMRQMLAPNFNISLTVYPDAYQITEAKRRYNIDMRPKSWTRS